VTRKKIVQPPMYVDILTPRGTRTRTALAATTRIVRLAVIPVKSALMSPPEPALPGMMTVTPSAISTRIVRTIVITVRSAMMFPLVLFGTTRTSAATVMVFATGVNPARPVAIEETLALSVKRHTHHGTPTSIARVMLIWAKQLPGTPIAILFVIRANNPVPGTPFAILFVIWKKEMATTGIWTAMGPVILARVAPVAVPANGLTKIGTMTGTAFATGTRIAAPPAVARPTIWIATAPQVTHIVSPVVAARSVIPIAIVPGMTTIALPVACRPARTAIRIATAPMMTLIVFPVVTARSVTLIAIAAIGTQTALPVMGVVGVS
jgi:hypothetical protein